MVLFWVLLALSSVVIINGQYSYDDSVKILKDYYTMRRDQMFHDLYQLKRSRVKREESKLITLPDQNVIVKKVWNVTGIENMEFLDFSTFADPTSIMIDNNFVLGTKDGNVKIFTIAETIELFDSLRTSNKVPVKIKAFYYEETQWLAVLFFDPHEQTHYIQLLEVLGKMKERQQIVTKGLADMDILQIKDKLYLVVSVHSQKTSNGTTRQGYLTIFEWRFTQFHSIDSQATIGAVSVAIWEMNGLPYIAVAQEFDDLGNTQIGSRICHLRHNKIKWIQKIETRMSKKVIHFEYPDSHYLLFIGEQKATVYWWTGDQFLASQILDGTENARDASAIILNNNEALFSITLKNKVYFYTEDLDATFTKSFETKLQRGSFISATLQKFHNGYFLATIHEDKYQNFGEIFKINVHQTEIRDNHQLDPLSSCFRQLNSTLASLNRELDQLYRNHDKVWVKNKKQTVSAQIIVKGKTTFGKETQINSVNVEADKTLPFTKEDIFSQYDKIVKKLKSVDFRNIILNQENITIDKRIDFNVIKAKVVRIGSLKKSVIINGHDYQRLVTGTLQKKGQNVVIGNLTVKSLTVNNYLDLKGRLNNMVYTDIIKTKGPVKHFMSKMRFQDVEIRRNMLIQKGTKLNEIPIEKYHNVPEKAITGFKTFKNIKVNKKFDLKHTLNGESIKDFTKNLVDLNGRVKSRGSLNFHSPINVKGKLTINGLINGKINLTRLLTETMTVDGDQTINSPAIFNSSVHVYGDVTVLNKINDVDLDKELVTLNTPQTLTGELTFEEDLTFEKDVTINTLNGLNFREQVVLKDEDAVIRGKKTFDNLIIREDLSLSQTGTINDIKPSDLSKQLLNTDGKVVLDNVIIHGDATFEKGINGINLKDLHRNIWRKSADQVINIPMRFPNKMVIEGNVQLDTTVNGLNLMNDLVHTRGNETIYGEVTFKDDVRVLGDVFLNSDVKLNNVDLSLFDSTVARRTGNQVIAGNKSFQELHVLGNVFANKVNGYDITREVMLTDKEQIVSGHVTLEEPVINVSGNLDADTVVVDGKVNERDLSEFAAKTVRIDRPNTFPIKDKNFIAGISTKDFHSFGTINGIKMSDIKERAITTNTSQAILAAQNFTGRVGFKGMLQVTRVNGIELGTYLARVVRTDTDEKITGKIRITGTMNVNGDIDVDGKVNGIDLKDLSKRAMSKTRPNVLSASLTVNSDVTFKHLSLDENSFLDGVKLNDLVFLGREAVLNDLTFEKDVVIDGNIVIDGLVNECNLTKLMEEAVYLDKTNQLIEGPIHFNSMEIGGKLLVKNVNGVDVEKLEKLTMTTTSHQEISAKYHFKDGFTAHKLIVEKLINGVNMSYLMNDVVFQNKPTSITGHKSVGTVIVENDLIVDGDVYGLIDGVDLAELNSDAVFLDGEQTITGEKSFRTLDTSNLILDGTLNGIRIPEDVVLVNSTELITGKVTMNAPCTVHKEILVSGLVDNLNLTDLEKIRISLSRNEEINSRIRFLAPINVTGDLKILGKVNDIEMDKIVTKTGRFDIDGKKTFLQEVEVTGDLDVRVINGIDIYDLNRNLIRLDRNETIPGTTLFYSPLIASNLHVDSINDINLNELDSQYNRKAHETALEFNRIKTSIQDQFSHLKHISDIIEYNENSKSLAYFRMFDDLVLSGRQFAYATLENSKSYLFFWTWTCQTRIYEWLKDRYVYMNDSPYKYIPAGEYVILASYYLEGSNCRCNSTYVSKLSYVYDDKQALTQLPYTDIIDAKYFHNGKEDCIVVSAKDRLYVLTPPSWETYNQIIVPKAGKLALHENKLVLATSASSSFKVFAWDKSKFVPIQKSPKIPKSVKDVVWVGDYLVMLEESSGAQHIYQLRRDGYLVKKQTLFLPGIETLGAFSTMGGELYIAMGSKNMISICQWKGYDLFEVIQSISSTTLTDFSIIQPEEKVILLGLNFNSTSSKLLKATFRG